MAERRGHGWWPYLLPMVLFLGLGELTNRVPDALQPWFLPLRVLAPAALLVHYFRGGAYPELRGFRPGLRGVALDVGVGLVGAAVWVAPYLWSEGMRPDPEAAFDPQQLGPGLVAVTLAIRALGYSVVTPFVEELMVRSWLLRYVDVFDKAVDFRDVPIGRYSLRSFLVVVIYFTLSHVPWEWPVAVAWVVGTQVWFYHRRNLLDLVIVHATSNFAIFVFVVTCTGRLHDATGAPLDLWFFL